MQKDRDALLNKIVIQKTGDFETDLRNIANTLRENFKYVEDKDFIQALDAYLREAYTTKTDGLENMLIDIERSGDDEFFTKMREMFIEDPAQAQFEVSLFIRKMEDEFSDIKPKMDEKKMSIFKPLDKFRFTYDNPEIKLVETERDYAQMYKEYARLLFLGNEWRDAAEMYQQAMLWNPYDTSIYFELAELYQEMDQFGMSYPTILSGLDHSIMCSELAQGFYLLGKFYLSKLDKETAYQLFQVSLSWQENEATYVMLKKLKQELGNQVSHLDDTEQLLQKLSLDQYPSQSRLDDLQAYIETAKISPEAKNELQRITESVITCRSKQKDS